MHFNMFAINKNYDCYFDNNLYYLCAVSYLNNYEFKCYIDKKKKKP